MILAAAPPPARFLRGFEPSGPQLAVVLPAFNTPSLCRTDCTVPVCGEGVLDGGEVCDDGNTNDGDGCAADCKHFD